MEPYRNRSSDVLNGPSSTWRKNLYQTVKPSTAPITTTNTKSVSSRLFQTGLRFSTVRLLRKFSNTPPARLCRPAAVPYRSTYLHDLDCRCPPRWHRAET